MEKSATQYFQVLGLPRTRGFNDFAGFLFPGFDSGSLICFSYIFLLITFAMLKCVIALEGQEGMGGVKVGGVSDSFLFKTRDFSCTVQ